MPKMRCRRCLAIIDDRASGSACCSSRIAAVAVALGDAHLGEPLQRVRLARPASRGRGAARWPRSAPTAASSRSPDSNAASPISADANAAARSAPLRRGGRLQVAGDLDDLGVGRRPVEHVLGRAQVAVEDRVGDLGVLPRAAQLEAHPVEPVAGAVGQQPLQRDEIEHLPVRARRRARAVAPRRPRPAATVEVGREAARTCPAPAGCRRRRRRRRCRGRRARPPPSRGRPTSSPPRASRTRRRAHVPGVGAVERLAVGRRQPSGRRSR